MADTKISGLPASTVPLAGTEVLPVVQSTTTKQVSIANVTAGRDVSALTLATSGSTSTTPVLGFNASNSTYAAGATISGSYLQNLLQNKSGTANASTNYVLSNDLGTDSTYYGEFGMNSSVFSASTPADFFSINNGIYFSGHDGDVTVGSGNGYKHYMAWGTTGQSAHVINATGALGFSTNLGTTPALSGTTGYGNSGEVLVSAGSAAAPAWSGSLTGLTTIVASGTGKFGTTVGVGAATPAASGAGITFPATQSASTDANTLDDYKEGTWTPVDGSAAALSLTIVSATYVKVGKVVYIASDIIYPTTSSPDVMLISGMPYTIGVDTGGSIGYTSFSPSTQLFTQFSSSLNGIRLQTAGGVTVANVSISGKRFQISGFYFV